MSTLLTVRVRASTGDQDSGVFLVGDLPQLSEWGALTPLPLSFADGAFTTTIALPAHTELQYKYVVACNGTVVIWEGPPFLNRKLKTGEQGTAMDVDDGSFGSDQHAAVRVVARQRSDADDCKIMSSDSVGESLDPSFSDSSMQSHFLGVCVAEVETVPINGAETHMLECVGRQNVALPISCSEPKVALDLEANFGNAPKYAEEQNIVAKPDSCLASDISEGSSALSEDNGPVSVASDAFEPDITHPEQLQRVERKGSAFERSMRGIVGFFRTLFTRKRSRTHPPPECKHISRSNSVIMGEERENAAS